METLENVVAALFVAHFAWSYYWNCYRKGYTMDLWHFQLLSLLFTIHVMLPFSRSDLNIFALGTGLLRRTQNHVTEAYAISALGYLAVLAGGQVWRFHLGTGIRRAFAGTLEVPSRLSLALLNSRALLRVHALLAAIMLAAIILIYWRIMGFGFNVGSILVGNPTLRPFGNFATFYGNLIGSYCLVRVVRYRELDLIALTALLVTELSFYGSRSSLLSIFSVALLVGMVRMGRRLKPIWFLGMIFGAAALSIFLDALRKPNFSLGRVFGTFALNTFYGNTFSDTRDFALILSFWNGTYFAGKTYLAALMAFVPQSFSQFRTEWSLGVVTATMAGFPVSQHAGFRVGLVGEAFLNFGLPGVILMGLFLGAVSRLIDLEIKRSVRYLPKSDLRAYSFLVLMLVIGTVQNSSQASVFYTTMLVLGCSWVFTRVFGARSAADAQAREQAS